MIPIPTDMATTRITSTIPSINLRAITSPGTTRRPGTRPTTRPTITATATTRPPALVPAGHHAAHPAAGHASRGHGTGRGGRGGGGRGGGRGGAEVADTTPLPAGMQPALTPVTSIPETQANRARQIDDAAGLDGNQRLDQVF